ncbi:GH3 auxin-responsive promoter family protein [Chloroflexota bacterium]
MEMQEYLLLNEIGLVADTELGKKIMNNHKPASVDEFRRVVPFTTYEDYAPYLDEQREDVLYEKPHAWLHTSGRTGAFKWIPFNLSFYQALIDNVIGSIILACATEKGEILLKGGERAIANLPPPPYAPGFVIADVAKSINLQLIPPLEIANQMEFKERIEKAFKMAIGTRIDIVGSLSSILVKIGEAFTERKGGMEYSLSMLHPAAIFRIARAVLRAKMEKRQMLPKDLWSVKCIFGAGTDADVYRDKVMYYWGKNPYQSYGAMEIGNVAMQSWTKKTMTFIPYFSFLEFIPEEESFKSRQEQGYKPSTVLLNEVKAGECYEIVGTNFHGMPFMRYRPGDLIEIVSLKDNETGISTPQMVFKSRADDLIDIAAFTRLDEKTIWQAINGIGITYADWTILKEYVDNEPILHLYIEPKEHIDSEEYGRWFHDQLKEIDRFYNDLDKMLELKPVKVTILSEGTFDRYYQEKSDAGVELAYLKPPHMNARSDMIESLVRLSREA